MKPEKIIESMRSVKDKRAKEDADGAQLLLDGMRERFGEPRVTEDNYCIVAELSLKKVRLLPLFAFRGIKRERFTSTSIISEELDHLIFMKTG